MLDIKLGRSMEDLFFHEQEQRLKEARAKLENMRETKENLASVSGIKNDAVLEKLLELGIRPETLATLLAIPLVEVAWADGEMQDEERHRLITYAQKAGAKKNVTPEILDVWLSQKPDPALFDAWGQYIQGLKLRLSDEERRALKEEVISDAQLIAKSAGGFLGFGKFSGEEKAVLAKLEAAFC